LDIGDHFSSAKSSYTNNIAISFVYDTFTSDTGGYGTTTIENNPHEAIRRQSLATIERYHFMASFSNLIPYLISMKNCLMVS